MLLADRGYDADWIRTLVSEQGAWANIPPKRNRKDAICFSPYLYRARNLVERFFNKIKQCRRIATRYDKLAANYLAFIKLASIRIWLRASRVPRPNSLSGTSIPDPKLYSNLSDQRSCVFYPSCPMAPTRLMNCQYKQNRKSPTN